MELNEFRTNLINDIQASSIVDGVYEYVAFLDYMKEFFRDSGNCSELSECYYKREARDKRYKSMCIHGYSLEASDNSLYLYIGDYNGGEITTINTEILDKNIKLMVNFVENVIKGFFVYEDIEKSSRIYAVAMDIATAISKKNIDRIHLLFASTNIIGKKVKLKDIDPIATKVGNMYVDVTTFDIQDLLRASSSEENIEPIEIETKDFGCSGIPCLEADLGQDSKYSAYLGIVPGYFLASIYRKYGGKLLESNVRAFLNVRGTVNKGIRNTILHEQNKFFTYNNGIACTADSLEMNADNTKIIKVKNFQIVNGGQTTASLANAIIKDNAEENVKDIYVPMKLTVLSSPDPELVADIAKYANSQNKVSASDLVSNNKFYIQLEKLSRKIYTPKNQNTNLQTLWYFERTRGQYDRDLASLERKSEKDTFKAIRPKSQLFKKPDLAKFWNSYIMQPYNVAWGAEVNAGKFQELVDTKFNKDENSVNEFFYKELISKAILFIESRKITSQTEWYKQNSGILAQVAPYVVSKLVYEVEKYDGGKYSLNLKSIWDSQQLSNATISEIIRVGECVWSVISRDDRQYVNIAEWCKREACWEIVKKEKFELSPNFVAELILKTDSDEEKIAAKKDQRSSNDTEYSLEIFNKGKDYWSDVLERAKLDGLVGQREVDLLNAAMKSCVTMRLVNNKQAAAIRTIMKNLENRGLYIK